MAYYIASDRFGNYDLAHHGILGQKWGIRRYQNKDGSLTDKGRARYKKQIERAIQKNGRGRRAAISALNNDSLKTFGKMSPEQKNMMANMIERNYRGNSIELKRSILQNDKQATKLKADLIKIQDAQDDTEEWLNKEWNKLSGDGMSKEQILDHFQKDPKCQKMQEQWKQLSEKRRDTGKKLGERIVNLYKERSDELLSAHLKDLKLDDTKIGRDILLEIINSNDDTIDNMHFRNYAIDFYEKDAFTKSK